MNPITLNFMDKKIEMRFQEHQYRHINCSKAIKCTIISSIIQLSYWFAVRNYISGITYSTISVLFMIFYYEIYYRKTNNWMVKNIQYIHCGFVCIEQFTAHLVRSHQEELFLFDITLQRILHNNVGTDFVKNSIIYSIFVIIRLSMRYYSGFNILGVVILGTTIFGISEDYHRIKQLRYNYLLKEQDKNQVFNCLSNESIIIVEFNQIWERFIAKFQNLAYRRNFAIPPVELLRRLQIKSKHQTVINFLFSQCRRFEEHYHFEAVESTSKQKFKIDCVIQSYAQTEIFIKISKIEKRISPISLQPLFYRQLVMKLKQKGSQLFYRESLKNLVAVLLTDPHQIQLQKSRFDYFLIKDICIYLCGDCKYPQIYINRTDINIDTSAKLLNLLFYLSKRLLSITFVHVNFNPTASTIQFQLEGETRKHSKQYLFKKIMDRVLLLIGLENAIVKKGEIQFILLDLDKYNKFKPIV